MKNFALPLLFLSAVLASAQSGLSPVSSISYLSQTPQSGSLSITVRTSGPPPVVGAPFSGKEERKSEQLLPDGSRITLPTQQGAQIARDAQGRTRNEHSLSSAQFNIPGRPTPKPVMIVEINDVVEGAIYILDPARRIAYRVKASPAARSATPSKPGALPFQVNAALIAGGAPEVSPKTTVESLGSKYIQGLKADGERKTNFFPAGSRGNDRPITEVTETWVVPNLQLTILQTSKTPVGNNSMEIVNLIPLNPSPDLFRPPPGYQVRDQPETFTVDFGDRP